MGKGKEEDMPQFHTFAVQPGKPSAPYSFLHLPDQAQEYLTSTIERNSKPKPKPNANDNDNNNNDHDHHQSANNDNDDNISIIDSSDTNVPLVSAPDLSFWDTACADHPMNDLWNDYDWQNLIPFSSTGVNMLSGDAVNFLLPETEGADINADDRNQTSDRQHAEPSGNLQQSNENREPMFSNPGNWSYAMGNPTTGLVHPPTLLEEYFFNEVIALYSCFDSERNPIRVFFRRGWQSSQTLYHTIRSMAAACLSRDFPELERLATDSRAKALSSLKYRSGLETDYQDALLCHIVLGQTASWHSPDDFALLNYRDARLILRQFRQINPRAEELTFFEDAVQYWEMILTFFLGDCVAPTGDREPVENDKNYRSRVPHPWSGTAKNIITLLGRVGRLVYRARTRLRRIKFFTQGEVQFFQNLQDTARKLEKQLLDHRTTDTATFLGTGDASTPIEHMRNIDEAYRGMALLQLYRVFPDLLVARYQPWSVDALLRPILSFTIPTVAEQNVWLSELAMHILGLLKTIPFESRTRSVQPLILLAVACELRLQPTKDESLDLFALRVVQWRRFVSYRLTAYKEILPLQKNTRILDLIHETWKRLDSAHDDDSSGYWLDMVLEKNLGMLIG